MKIFIGRPHGCDINYTYRLMTDELMELGEIVENAEEADFIVFPATCSGSLSIIKIVMDDILQVLKKKKKDAVTIVTGCITSKIKDASLSEMVNTFLNNNFDYIIPQQNMGDIISIISPENTMSNEFGACIIRENKADFYISKGCTNRCSFCKVNYLHMPLQSAPFEEVKHCLDSLTEEINTVNLIGMNVAQYGQDLGYQNKLLDIIKLLEQKDNITRVALQGMAFKDAIKNNFAESLKSSKIKMIGGSIETGSPRILSMMNKGYTIPELLAFWQEINESSTKELCTDIIAGFPTETLEDIQLTMQLLDTIRPQEIMIRKYQNSPYIPSGKYPQLSDEEINEHFDTYIKELKLRGCPTISYDETKIN